MKWAGQPDVTPMPETVSHIYARVVLMRIPVNRSVDSAHQEEPILSSCILVYDFQMS